MNEINMRVIRGYIDEHRDDMIADLKALVDRETPSEEMGLLDAFAGYLAEYAEHRADEELGSLHSRPLIEETARDSRATLVLEPSLGGALKASRKGERAGSWCVSGDGPYTPASTQRKGAAP